MYEKCTSSFKASLGQLAASISSFRNPPILKVETVWWRMKRIINITIKVLASITIFSVLSVRVSYTCSQAPDTYRPIYMSFDELRSSVKSLPAESLRDPGKMLVNGNLIFVSERYQGIHVIDNSDPESPQNITFIRVPGNIDIAMKGDILYADSTVDLVSIDVSNPSEAFVTQRLENIYPNGSSPK